MTQVDKFFKRIVQGSFHQGSTSIFDEKSVGKQCVANCAIAALHTSIIPLYKWSSHVLDQILKGGDKLYNDIHSDNDFLQVQEIGKQISVNENLYAFQIKHEYFGCVSNKCSLDTINMPLEKATFSALMENKTSQWNYCILCVGNQHGTTASLLCLSSKNCYVFDPRSRNSYGIPVANSTSVLMMFPTRQKMISYLCSTEVKYQVPTDVFLMCHIEFHMINCGVEKYFSDQHYLSFYSDHHQKLEQSNHKSEESKTCKSDHSQNECGERCVSNTLHTNRKRDRAQKMRDKMRLANKQKRDEAKKLETKKRLFAYENPQDKEKNNF